MATGTATDPLGVRLTLGPGGPVYYSLARLQEQGLAEPAALPVTVRVWLEMLLRQAGSEHVSPEDALLLARWTPGQASDQDLPFFPSRELPDPYSRPPMTIRGTPSWR